MKCSALNTHGFWVTLPRLRSNRKHVAKARAVTTSRTSFGISFGTKGFLAIVPMRFLWLNGLPSMIYVDASPRYLKTLVDGQPSLQNPSRICAIPHGALLAQKHSAYFSFRMKTRTNMRQDRPVLRGTCALTGRCIRPPSASAERRHQKTRPGERHRLNGSAGYYPQANIVKRSGLHSQSSESFCCPQRLEQVSLPCSRLFLIGVLE